MKYFRVSVIALSLSILASITTFSGQWKFDDYIWRRYWYQRDDGTYPSNQWEYINGNWYYFDGEGWMMENAWIQGKYYVGDDGPMMYNCQTTDGFLVDSEGVYIPGSGDCINGTYRFLKDEPIAIVDGSYAIRGGYGGTTITVEVKRVNDFTIRLKWSDRNEDYFYKANSYGQSYQDTYFCTDEIEGISFRDGNLIYWPEDGDYTDYYISVFEKIN